LVASFHAIIYAYARNSFALARAGYLPRGLSICHRRRRTPHVALVAGALVGYGAALAIAHGEAIFGSLPVGAALIHMTAFAALIAYILQMVSFVILRARPSDIKRPYVSPLGRAGAIFAGVASSAVLIVLLLNKDTIAGLYGCAVWFGLGLAYFTLRGRGELVRTPEESFALENSGKAADR
jgi:ethanolamine permease